MHKSVAYAPRPTASAREQMAVANTSSMIEADADAVSVPDSVPDAICLRLAQLNC
jgi:hypothetical protein